MELSLEELRAQRTELLPERIEMARRRKRRRRNRVTCTLMIGVYPPEHPCYKYAG
jgi:hypothetical protein